MENYQFNRDNHEANKLQEIDFLNELFDEGAEMDSPVTPDSLQEFARQSIQAIEGTSQTVVSENVSAVRWTKTNPDPDNYQGASCLIKHDATTGVWKYRYRQLDSHVIDSETGWATLLSEYKLTWDGTAVVEANRSERFLPSHTQEDVESISNVISFNFADKDQLGEELYEQLETGRDAALITPELQTDGLNQSDIDSILEHIQTVNETETTEWHDYGDLPDLLYKRLGNLVDETIKNSRDGKNDII